MLACSPRWLPPYSFSSLFSTPSLVGFFPISPSISVQNEDGTAVVSRFD